MNKRLEVFSLVLFLVFAGCSKDKGMENKKITLRFMGGSFKLYDDIRNQLAGEFEKKYPDIRVKYESVPGSSYGDKLLTEIAGGKGPDVFIVFNTSSVIDYVRRGTLMDLTPYVEKDKEFNIEEIYPALIDNFSYENRLYALPANANVNVLYYNKILFDEIGEVYPNNTWTWETMREAAQRLIKTNENGRITQFGLSISNPWNGGWIGFAIANGGEMWNKDKTKCIINSKETREAIEYLRDLYYKYKVSPNPSDPIMSTQTGHDLFASNRVAMFIQGRWCTSIFKNVKDLEWRIAHIPITDHDYARKRVTTIYGMAWGVNSQTRYPQLAYELAKYLTSPESLKVMIDFGDSLPINKNPKVWEEFLADPTRPQGENQIYAEAIEYAYSEMDLINPNLTSREAGNMMKMEMEKFGAGMTTAEEALKKIEAELNKRINDIVK